MKVLLLKDQKKLGQRGDIVEVADAYAMNAVIPQGIGRVATPDVIARAEKENAKKASENKAEEEKARKKCTSLKGKTVTVSAAASDGTLFAALHETDIVRAVKDQHNILLASAMVRIAKPIKSVGDHELVIDCGYEQLATITVHVTA